MISSSRQLKDKVRNISDGNSNKATTLIRNFMMERFLERVSISSYRDNFILKGGMLVASIVGVDMRATMDIDTTVKFGLIVGINQQSFIRRVSLDRGICRLLVLEVIHAHVVRVKSIINVVDEDIIYEWLSTFCPYLYYD